MDTPNVKKYVIFLSILHKMKRSNPDAFCTLGRKIQELCNLHNKNGSLCAIMHNNRRAKREVHRKAAPAERYRSPSTKEEIHYDQADPDFEF